MFSVVVLGFTLVETCFRKGLGLIKLLYCMMLSNYI